MKKLIFLAVLIGLGAAGAGLYAKYAHSETTVNFRTATVERDELLITVGASGTVEPEEVVDIGAQVVGRIKALGDDPRSSTDERFAGKHLDYGSPVVEGMVLAQIDPSIYNAQLLQQQATVDRAKADLQQLEAKSMQAEAEWQRAQKLRTLKLGGTSLTGLAATPSPTKGSAASSIVNSIPIKGISDADYILAQANFEMAKANVEVGKATIEQQAAALTLAETNVGYTTIKSPTSGTIIERRVNIGQTVVSSLNAPSLFLIAKDLRKMQVWAQVNEADIGRLKVEMPVRFTVDAFPKDVFRGKVFQIRLNATSTQNVVTYTVVISVANDDLKLLPYLTADVKFEVESRQDVLLVPNSALRYQPKPQYIAANPDAPAEEDASETPSAEKVDSKKSGRKRKGGSDQPKTGTVWIKQENQVYPIEVVLGLTDGVSTEVSGRGLTEELVVVTGEQRAEEASADATNNPFAPKFFKGKGGGGGGGGKKK